jgi:YD repeat-containing protein
VLGLALVIHCNDDYRVVASTDFGGERYQIGLDTSDNMTRPTLPDGNVITLNYDQYSGLSRRLIRSGATLGTRIIII